MHEQNVLKIVPFVSKCPVDVPAGSAACLRLDETIQVCQFEF